MSKKRKDSAQSSTLLDFFGKGGSPANKKPKTQTQNRSKKTPVKRERFTVAPEDIIVIDSDDENDNIVKPEPLDADFSDVEIVDQPSSRNRPSSRLTNGHSENVSPTKAASSHTSYGHAELLDPPPPPVDGAIESFGIPYLLLEEGDNGSFGFPTLLNEPSKDDLRIPKECSIPSTPMLESSNTPLKRPLPVTSNSNEEQCPISKPKHTPNRTNHLGVIDISDDEWGTGDDEMAVENTLNLDADTSTTFPDIDLTLDDDPLEDVTPGSETCPICGLLFDAVSAMEIQQHVNSCLDSGAGPSHKREETPSKPLRTISSLRATSVDALQLPTKTEDEETKPRGPNAFSTIMNGYKENQAWKEASAAEDRNFRATKGNGGRRKAPFYKVMTGMPIAVDAFRYGAIPGVTAYFLTHAHSDHYTNLSSNWKNGPIYCSEGTANLIKHMLGVDAKWVHPLPMDIPTIIPDTGDVRVTLIEANHCPGSCLFLFEGKQTVDAGDSTFKSQQVGSARMFRYLHCGDFRASPQHVLHPAVKGKKIDCVYLDTTYLDPRYCFPSQPQVIDACAELAKRLVTGSSVLKNAQTRNMSGWFVKKEESNDKPPPDKGKTLVVVGTYSIGKERIVKAIAKALQTKVYCDARKTAILRCQSDTELDALLTSDPLSAGVHLVPLGVIASDKLKLYVERWRGHFSKAIGFRPTGWTYSQPSGSDSLPSISSVIARSQQRTFTSANLNPMKNSTTTLQVYGVPYSEHSSFFELTCFALSFDWGRMIATVNVGSEASRGKMAKWVEKWDAERKKRGKVEVVSHRAPDYW